MHFIYAIKYKQIEAFKNIFLFISNGPVCIKYNAFQTLVFNPAILYESY